MVTVRSTAACSALMTFIVQGETNSALKMHQKRLAAGSARTRWGAHSAPPDPLASAGGDPHPPPRRLRRLNPRAFGAISPPKFFLATALLLLRLRLFR